MNILVCPMCEKKLKFKKIFEKDGVFACASLLQKNANINPTQKGNANFLLLQCQDCGFIFNKKFDFKKIQDAYFNQTLYFQQSYFTKRLNNYILKVKDFIMSFIGNGGGGKDLLEIAPGEGDLLLLLSKEMKRCYSVDPSMTSAAICKGENIQHIKAFFNKNIKRKLNKQMDLVVFRHLLEHLENPGEFLKDVVDICNNNGYIFIEIPNAENILNNSRFIDIYHDHVGYIQKNTLDNILNSLGCENVGYLELYRGKHIGMMYQKKTCVKSKLPVTFYNEYENKKLHNEIKYLNCVLDKYKNIAIYGAGGQSQTILNHLSDENYVKINICFEINKQKINNFMQGSDIKIQKPSRNNLKNIDCIILAIPNHEEYAFENEILDFIKKGWLDADVIKTANGVELVRFI